MPVMIRNNLPADHPIRNGLVSFVPKRIEPVADSAALKSVENTDYLISLPQIEDVKTNEAIDAKETK